VSTFELKVYYEDTDCLGVVYHANYLKYFERARTEMVSATGKPIEIWNREGYNFVVYKMSITFHKPGKLNDRLRVETSRRPMKSPYRLVLDQKLYRADELLTEAEVQLVCLDPEMKLRELPASF
jgi:tol-pal system-associated acyl-CoA thioesterase